MTPRIYSDKFKAEALQRVSQIGWRPAARELGLDHKSLFRWAEEAGLDHHALSLEASERNRAAAVSKNSRVARERAEARERVITRLLKTTEIALARELEILVAGGLTKEDLQAVTNSRMKAIQQFELLEGRVTDRQDYGLENMLAGVAIAFQKVLELAHEEQRQILRETFARELRDLQTKGMPELSAGEDEVVEEADFEEAAP